VIVTGANTRLLALRPGNGSDDFELNRDWSGQRAYFDRGAGWVGVIRTGEILGVKTIVSGKIFFDVSKKDCDIDNVVPFCAGVFQDKANVLKHGPALRLDVVANDGSVAAKLNAGNLRGATRTGADPGKEEEIARAFRVRERAYWLRGAIALVGAAHDLRKDISDEQNAGSTTFPAQSGRPLTTIGQDREKTNEKKIDGRETDMAESCFS